ncbi:Zinc (Zn2)-Iron (Fe2) Permease (ZIP) Family [Thraustotheca clavata]|uniref:Zinc (Zn2)-Iron (Fe2) Permease (ZIP) Family n=1 Tax=Thraustotheca clavata TaxID=74557 RepID=A0A1W0ABB7_9STRA|nr:Zinc (Zn2)-Iron (Fe2) Permease (ZIP) Family [Thraustotheca clavata]
MTTTYFVVDKQVHTFRVAASYLREKIYKMSHLKLFGRGVMEDIVIFNSIMCVVLLVLTVIFSLLPVLVSTRAQSTPMLESLLHQKLPFVTAGVFLATGMIHLLPDAVKHYHKYCVMTTAEGVKISDFPIIYVLCCFGCMIIWAIDLLNLGDSGKMMAVAAAAKPNYETSLCKIHVPSIASYGIERRLRGYSGGNGKMLSPQCSLSPKGIHEGQTYGSCSCDHTMLNKSDFMKHSKQSTELDVLLRENQNQVEVAEEPVGRCGSDPHVHAHVEGSISEHVVFSGESAILPYLLAALFSLHSLIAGFTLGMNSELSRTAIAIALAIVSHKFIEAISVGANFAKAKDSVNPSRSMAVLIFYSFMTPLGIVLGMLLTSQLQGPSAQYAQALALGIGSGSFIYLAFHEMSDEHSHEATPTIQKIALFTIGAGSMALNSKMIDFGMKKVAPNANKRRCGAGRCEGTPTSPFLQLGDESLMSIYGFLNGKEVLVISSTCKYFYRLLQTQWPTLFKDFLKIEANVYAAPWMEYLKRFYCALEKRCFVCFKCECPSIRPWQYVSLCDDHRKHPINSVLISKTYAKEQFTLNDTDLAPLQYIVRGIRRMKLYLESETLYCAVRKHGGVEGLKRIQDKKIIRWEKRHAIKDYRKRQVDEALADKGISSCFITPEFCSTYSDYLNQPKSKHTLEIVVRCITGHASRLPGRHQSTRRAMRLESLSKYLQQVGQASQFNPTHKWIIDYANSNDTSLTPTRAFSKAESEARRKDDLQTWLHHRNLSYSYCDSVFGDLMKAFVEHGEIKVGFGQYINSACQVSLILEGRMRRLQDVTSQLSLGRMNGIPDDIVVNHIFAIPPLRIFVLDGVVRFFGEVHICATGLVNSYKELLRRHHTLEDKLEEWFYLLNVSMETLGLERGFLIKEIGERGITTKSVDAMLRQILDEYSRTQLILNTLPGLTVDSKELQNPTVEGFIRNGYAILNRSFHSDGKSFAHALRAHFEGINSRRQLLHDVIMEKASTVDLSDYDRDFNGDKHHLSVFRAANEYIEQDCGNVIEVATQTFIQMCHENLLWKAVKALGVSMKVYHDTLSKLGDPLIREYILVGSVRIEGLHNPCPKKLILYLIFLYRCPFLHQVTVYEVLRICMKDSGMGKKPPSYLKSKFNTMCHESYSRIDVGCFSNTWAIIIAVVSGHIKKYKCQQDRLQNLHQALTARHWPQISFSNLELKEIYLTNGLPCYCGIEITTMDQLVEALIAMYRNIGRRKQHLDILCANAGIPLWTPKVNAKAAWLTSTYTSCGAVMISEAYVLDDPTAIIKHITESNAYDRQMRLSHALGQQQLNLNGIFDTLDAAVIATTLKWIEHGFASCSLKLAHENVLTSVDHIVDFILEHTVHTISTCSGCTSMLHRSLALLCLLSEALSSSDSFWGRIYLRDGVLPIQYFKDSYGGAIPDNERQFVLPLNNLGCSAFDGDDLARIANHTASGQPPIVVLDRGECSFQIKSKNVQEAGAAGLIIVSNDEEAIRPVAHVAKGEIQIPTVMVRHSAGELFRAVSAREAIYGKLVPMTCHNSVCGPESTNDSDFMHSFRGGILTDEEGKLYDFLSSSFGSPLSKLPMQTAAAQPAHACEPLTNLEQVKDKCALISLDNTNCSFLSKVSHAQLAGAASVIFVQRKNVILDKPSVEAHWHGYNITIPSLMVSHSTGTTLLHHIGQSIRLESDEAVADAWQEIKRLSTLSEWPTKKSRRDAYLSTILSKHGTTEDRRQAIRDSFINVVGGTASAWEKLVHSEKDEL